MKRGTLLLAAAATVVAALAMSSSGAGAALFTEQSPHAGCTPAPQGTVLETPKVSVAGVTVVTSNFHGFLYCGYHWASLPVRFKVDTTGAPSSVSAGFEAAARSAAGAWNQYWPLKPTSSIECSNGSLFCYDSTSATVVVRFGPLPEGVVGRATVVASGLTITSATVVLNSSLPSGVTWRLASGAQAVTGELPGATGSACGSVCGSFHDVQNVLTHELGHVFGLEDVGNEDACGADIVEAVDYALTMYGCFKTGDTSKRTLAWGDQLALVRLSQDY